MCALNYGSSPLYPATSSEQNRATKAGAGDMFETQENDGEATR